MAKKKDEKPDDDEEEEGGGKKKIIFIVVGLAAAGGVYQFVLKSPPPVEGEMPEEVAMEVEPIEGEIVELEEMILNIGGEGDGDSGFLRIGIAVVLEEGILAADFEMNSAIARDVAVQFLSSKTAEDLRSAEGRQKAKDELSVLLREAYDDEQVVRVLFTALVMQ